MSFLAPGEIDRVWLVEYVDYEDYIVGVYTTQERAEQVKAALLLRDARVRTLEMIRVSEMELDPDLLDHYWWERS